MPNRPLHFPEMVDYVEQITRPITDHIAKHDAWHLEQMQHENANRSAHTRALIAQTLGLATIIVGVAGLVAH